MTRLDSSLTKAFLLGIVALIVFFPSIATAKPAPSSLNQKIHNFETILNQAAKGKLDEAELASIRKMVDDAEAMLLAGDQASAEKLYSQAWGAYRAAVKIAQTQSHTARDAKKLEARVSSINSLIKQLKEADKGNETTQTSQIENIKLLLAQAEAAQDPVKALAIANQAYYTIKILLKNARTRDKSSPGQNFATPALKYADEIADNDAHFGLLDTASGQFLAQADAEYNKRISKAKRLREQAEEEAEQKNYEAAIRDIELSTKEIKRALKHIGLPVPGLSPED